MKAVNRGRERTGKEAVDREKERSNDTYGTSKPHPHNNGRLTPPWRICSYSGVMQGAPALTHSNIYNQKTSVGKYLPAYHDGTPWENNSPFQHDDVCAGSGWTFKGC